MKVGMLLDYKKNDFLTFSQIYNHTIVFSPVLYVAEFCCHTDVCLLWDQKG